MLTTDCNQHQEFSTQIGGYFATVGLPFQGGWNTLTVSYHRLLVTQQEIEIFTNRIYIVLMFLQRRFLRSMVGPPCNVDWTQPWHEILHYWNGRTQSFMGQLKCKPWSEMCLQHHWNLAHYFALLQKFLGQHPCKFLPPEGKPSWEVAAMDQDLWSSMLPEFFHFYKM